MRTDIRFFDRISFWRQELGDLLSDSEIYSRIAGFTLG
jgi:hypothetical protein